MKEGNTVVWENRILARNAPNYTIECQTCKINNKTVHYYGESGKNIVCRAQNHQSAINRKEEDHPLVRHHTTAHPDSEMSYVMSHSHSSSKPGFRQICEGVMISNSQADEILNSRAEWFQPAVIRLSARTGMYDD